MAISKALAFCALFCGALAFVPPAQQQQQRFQYQASSAQPRILAESAAAPQAEAEASWASLLLAGAGVGYAAAAATTFSHQGRTARAAEKPLATARTPIAYPIFTFRWLAVHALAVPTVFFLGAISSMQFIQR
eukprot:TRINITY_DN1244_c0_g1_i3.p2 TRINITY_DN1244_c0_g1~~TRINITY_DN1244_c0_g1_i3.p2  ORF type:complete len:155 (-),score=45.06 TRINITY_DN1244_c0_g1_i3:177-575(-)